MASIVALGALTACGGGSGTATVEREPTTSPALAFLCLAPQISRAVVPEVVGKELRAAGQQICDMGTRVGKIRGKPGDTVYEQDPAAGTVVPVTSMVNIKAR